MEIETINGTSAEFSEDLTNRGSDMFIMLESDICNMVSSLYDYHQVDNKRLIFFAIPSQEKSYPLRAITDTLLYDQKYKQVYSYNCPVIQLNSIITLPRRMSRNY